MIRKFLSAGAATAVVAGLAGPVFAGANDYVFEPVKAEVKKGDDVVVSVRLKHKANGKPVTDAVIIQTRIDMEPDGMGEMTSPLTPVPSNEPGVRRNPARARRSRRRGGRLLVCPPPGPRPRVRCRPGKHRYGSGAQDSLLPRSERPAVLFSRTEKTAGVRFQKSTRRIRGRHLKRRFLLYFQLGRPGRHLKGVGPPGQEGRPRTPGAAATL